MELIREVHDGVVVVTAAEPRIDAAVAIRFKDRMRELTQDAANRVILDLSTVDFIDSSGLGAIVAALKQLPPGRKLELAALTPTVERVFRLTRMDSVFVIHADVEAGLAQTSVQ
ncbi:MAG: STAS domain-containing protein [Rhodobacteraceae bacterium]|nr:STAS domain-containing protein [Paracoccaceae bacterium]